MGASAGTGVRGFAEGGSTSTPSSSAPAAPQRQIYQAQYEDYGLGATPEAQGILGSALKMGSYGNQMPTFTRTQAPPPQAQYNIPYRTTPDSSFQGMLSLSPFGRAFARTPEQQAANLIKDYRGSNLTEAQYNKMMRNPAMYLDFIRRVDAGENPTTIGYAAPPPIQYMTAAQQKAYNDKVNRELDQLISSRTTFDMQDDYSGGS